MRGHAATRLCPPYACYSSIDMAAALHPQTFLTFKISDEILAPRYGYPLKLRIPTKLGFKNPKWITAIFVTNRFPGGFWEDRGYNWFAGVGLHDRSPAATK